MKIKIENTSIPDVKIVIPEVFEDERGFFMEVYREDQFVENGLPGKFVQFNHSRSVKNVLRGLHFQWEPPMGKLMRVSLGEAFLVAVDIRKGSPTFGKWFGSRFSAQNKLLVWAPAGFARGFCVLSDFAEIQYFTTGVYNSKCESGIQWNDPNIGIEWPISNPILSNKDMHTQSLSEWTKNPDSNNFIY
jgi:dTDP-4-dehydrorhamnose 3,5-epimerase